MNEITIETRRESFCVTPTEKRKRMILAVLGIKEMTAREIATALGFSDLNAVKPRLTELCNLNLIEVIDKAYDAMTKRHVAVYKAVG